MQESPKCRNPLSAGIASVKKSLWCRNPLRCRDPLECRNLLQYKNLIQESLECNNRLGAGIDVLFVIVKYAWEGAAFLLTGRGTPQKGAVMGRLLAFAVIKEPVLWTCVQK